MKNNTPVKGNKSTLSLKVLKLRYKAAAANRAEALYIDDIRKTKDVKAWLKDRAQRGFIFVHSDKIVFRS